MTHTSIDFEAMTDAEINRWATERDPMELACGPLPPNCVVDDYATSADAALALCERWGVRIVGLYQWADGTWYATASIGYMVREGKSGTTSRTITNAACAARHAKEMADGN